MKPEVESAKILVKDLLGQNQFRYRILGEDFEASQLPKLEESELSTLHPADLAENLEQLDINDRVKILKSLSDEHAGEVLARLDEEIFLPATRAMEVEKLSRILGTMPADEAADVLGEFREERMDTVLKSMEEELRNETIELLSHEKDSAGGVMGKELVDFYPEITALEALEKLRRNFDSSDFLSYLYITNLNQELIGVVTLKHLILSPVDMSLGELMIKDVVHVQLDEDQEKIAYLAKKYDLQAIPVVNSQRQLVGIVAPEEISEIIEDEHEEDILRMAGLHEETGAQRDSLRAAMYRFPWLLATVFGGLVAAEIIEWNKDASHIWLLSFSPLILGLAGNVGIQSSTIIIRTLSSYQYARSFSLSDFLRETYTGILLAVACGLTLTLLIAVLQGAIYKGMILGASLFSVIILSALCSIAIPLIFNRLKIDPAVASGPLVTTLIDVCGLLLYFYCAYSMLQWFPI
jgi:magnesium transporter